MSVNKILYRCTGIARVLLGYSLHVPSTRKSVEGGGTKVEFERL